MEKEKVVALVLAAGTGKAHAEQYGEAVYAPWWETTGVLCAGGV